MTNELPNDDQSTRTGTRRFAVLGVTAGLLGGGAIGLMASMPSVTSAASDDTAAVVALQDDGGDTSDDSTDESSDRTEKLREILQSLVDDGTISADQADSVATHLAEQAPTRGDRDGRRGGGKGFPGRGVGSDAVVEVLGVDAETLRDELRAGSSIADVAEANGVDVQAVIDVMVTQASERLAAAVENERLTDDEAAEKLADLTERITDIVNGEGPTRG